MVRMLFQYEIYISSNMVGTVICSQTLHHTGTGTNLHHYFLNFCEYLEVEGESIDSNTLPRFFSTGELIIPPLKVQIPEILEWGLFF